MKNQKEDNEESKSFQTRINEFLESFFEDDLSIPDNHKSFETQIDEFLKDYRGKD